MCCSRKACAIKIKASNATSNETWLNAMVLHSITAGVLTDNLILLPVTEVFYPVETRCVCETEMIQEATKFREGYIFIISITGHGPRSQCHQSWHVPEKLHE